MISFIGFAVEFSSRSSARRIGRPTMDGKTVEEESQRIMP
jgi:hypothetical protein